jgi:hypothetical protein
MESLYAQIFEQDDPRFWVFTIGIIVLSGAGVIGYWKNRAVYSPILKSAYLQLLLLGVFPLFIIMWIGMLDVPYADIFLVVSLYWMGITLILLRRHTIIFFQEIPKDCSHPVLQKQWIVMDKLKGHSIFYLIGVVYFFSMGTFSLYLLLTK